VLSFVDATHPPVATLSKSDLPSSHPRQNAGCINADNFQTRPPNEMKISVRGAHHPHSSNGTTNSLKACC